MVWPAVVGSAAFGRSMALGKKVTNYDCYRQNELYLGRLLHVATIEALMENLALVIEVSRIGLVCLRRVGVAQLDLVLLESLSMRVVRI